MCESRGYVHGNETQPHDQSILSDIIDFWFGAEGVASAAVTFILRSKCALLSGGSCLFGMAFADYVLFYPTFWY